MGSTEKGLAAKGYRGGIFAGLEEEGRSDGYLRRGSGRGVSRVYGECFAQANSAGATLQRWLHGEHRGGGNGVGGPGYLRSNRLIEGACEHQWRVAKLTVLRVVEEEG